MDAQLFNLFTRSEEIRKTPIEWWEGAFRKSPKNIEDVKPGMVFYSEDPQYLCEVLSIEYGTYVWVAILGAGMDVKMHIANLLMYHRYTCYEYQEES